MKLNWDMHVNVIGSKISRVIDIIKKYSSFSRKKNSFQYTCIMLRYCLICITAFFHGSGSAAKNIFSKQKRAIRAISCAGYNAHTEPLFKIYKLLKIDGIYNC